MLEETLFTKVVAEVLLISFAVFVLSSKRSTREMGAVTAGIAAIVLAVLLVVPGL